MDAGIQQLLGLALAIIGFLGTIIICGLPMWKVYTFFIEHSQWRGLWKFCAIWNTGEVQCESYSYFSVPIPPDVQAARVLIIIAIILEVFGILLGVAGDKRTNFVSDERQNSKVAFASGVVFIIAGVLVLITVCWIANTVIRDSYNPELIDTVRPKLGASLYTGWFTTGLLFLGGGLLCSSFRFRDGTDYEVRYSNTHSV